MYLPHTLCTFTFWDNSESRWIGACDLKPVSSPLLTHYAIVALWEGIKDTLTGWQEEKRNSYNKNETLQHFQIHWLMKNKCHLLNKNKNSGVPEQIMGHPAFSIGLAYMHPHPHITVVFSERKRRDEPVFYLISDLVTKIGANTWHSCAKMMESVPAGVYREHRGHQGPVKSLR